MENTFCHDRQLSERKNLTTRIVNFSKGKEAVLLELPTGTGKNYNSFVLAEEFIKDNKIPTPRILVAVPEIALIKNYKEDAEKLGFSHLIPSMKIICHASLKKEEGENYDIVIVDECHWVVSKKRVESMKHIKSLFTILLSATIEEEEKEEIIKYRGFHTFKLELKEAISLGILPTPKIAVLTYNLCNERKIYEYKDIFNRVHKTTQVGCMEIISRDITHFREKHLDQPQNQFFKNKMLQLGSKRKRMLSQFKEEVALDLCKQLKDKGKGIVFCGSVKQAKELAKLTGGLSVSSSKTKRMNTETIEEFNSLDKGLLFAKDMLREGINLSGTKYGVEIQLGSKEREILQKIGRVLRHDNPIFYVIVGKGTNDEWNVKHIPKEFIVGNYTYTKKYS